MNRDVRAIQWLVGRTNGSDEVQALVLAIPGSFNGKWGQDVWKGVVGLRWESSRRRLLTFKPGSPLVSHLHVKITP